MRSFGELPAAVRGATWMVLGGLSLLVMAISIRVLAPKYSVLEMIFIRSVISFCLVLPWAYRVGPAGIRTDRLWLHVLRNVIHYLGNLGWFLGVTLISLADVSALQFTVPLFAIVMAAMILREKVNAPRWSATVLGFIGVLIIVRPGYIPIELGTAAVILSSFFYASSQIVTKKLSGTEPPQRVLFYMGAVFVPVSLGPAMFVWVTPDWADLVPFLILGATGYGAHFCIVRAFSAADASYVVAFDFVRLPVSAIFGYLLYDERTGLWTWLGAVIIFGATYYLTWSETRHASGRRRR